MKQMERHFDYLDKLSSHTNNKNEVFGQISLFSPKLLLSPKVTKY